MNDRIDARLAALYPRPLVYSFTCGHSYNSTTPGPIDPEGLLWDLPRTPGDETVRVSETVRPCWECRDLEQRCQA